MIQGGQKVDAFDGAAVDVVVVPADDVVFIGIGFLGNAVVDNQHPIGLLDGPDMRFDERPQIVGRVLLAGKETLDAVVTNLAFQQR